MILRAIICRWAVDLRMMKRCVTTASTLTTNSPIRIVRETRSAFVSTSGEMDCSQTVICRIIPVVSLEVREILQHSEGLSYVPPRRRLTGSTDHGQPLLEARRRMHDFDLGGLVGALEDHVQTVG